MTSISPALIGALLISLTLLVYWITVFVIIYHLVRFGIGTQPKKIAFTFLLGAIALFFVSVSLFSSIDFQMLIDELNRAVSGLTIPSL